MNIIKSIVSAVAVTGALSAQVYDFESPDITPGSPLATVPGWTESQASQTESPLSWVGLLNGHKAGVIGGYYNVPAADSYAVTLAAASSLVEASVSFDFAITDYTDYAFRDEFSFGVNDGDGALLAGIVLTPLAAINPASDSFGWNLSYTVLGVGTVDTLIQLHSGELYSVSLNFGIDSFELVVGNSLGSYSFITGAVGYDASVDVIGGLSFGFSKLEANPDFGDAILSFNNITVSAVPEPASAALLTACAGLAVAASRRRKRPA